MRAALSLLIALLPNAVKITAYRHLFGYRIGCDVRIGLTLFHGVGRVEIGDHCRIGHFNRFTRVPVVSVGSYCTIGNFNQFVSAGEFVHPRSVEQRGNQPQLLVGDHVGISTSHYFDIGDEIRIGEFTTIAGLRSVFFTHGVDVVNGTQYTKPIAIGAYSMIASNVTFHPGAGVADRTVVGMGAVVSRRFLLKNCLIGGNPAKLFGRLPETAKYFHRRVGYMVGPFTPSPFQHPPGADGR